MNFIAMDFETANYQMNSACSLALVMVQNSKIVGEYYTLINPQTTFRPQNIRIHGITPAMVTTAPKFSEMWTEIAHYFLPQRLIVAHNAPFDCGVLKACLTTAELSLPQFLSIDTVKTSKKFFPQWPSHRLNVCCQELGIALDHHHDALEDSRACANILLKEAELFGPEALKPFVRQQN